MQDKIGQRSFAVTTDLKAKILLRMCKTKLLQERGTASKNQILQKGKPGTMSITAVCRRYGCVFMSILC